MSDLPIRTVAPRWRRGVLALGLAALLMVAATACRPTAPTKWKYNSVRQAHSSATFGVHHDVRYRYNGKRIEVLKNKCAADNWYSRVRYAELRCEAKPRNGRLEVRWEWVWVKGAPPIARSQTYACNFDVSRSGKITRKKPGFLELTCNQFKP